MIEHFYESTIKLVDLGCHIKRENGCYLYILTELAMLNKFFKGKDSDFKHSYFYEFVQ